MRLREEATQSGRDLFRPGSHAREDEDAEAQEARPSVPTMLRQTPTGSLPLRAEVETSHGYAPYH